MSGPVGNMGLDTIRGEQLAVSEINAAGGIKSLGGAKLDLVTYDTESKVQTGQALVERAISEGAVAILGTTQSSVTMATTTVAERAKIPHVVTGSAAPEITERGYRYTFRILVTTKLTGATLVSYLRTCFESSKVPLKTLVNVYEDSAYGQASTANYRPVIEAAGLKYLDFSFKTGSTDLSGIALRLKRTPADAVIFSGYVKDGVTLVEALKEGDVNFPLFNTTIGITDPAFMKAIGPKDAEGYVGTQYFNPNVKPKGNPDGPRKFQEAYSKAYGEPGFLSAVGYTSLRTLAKAIEAAASTEPSKIRDALAVTEFLPEDGHILPYPKVKFDEAGQNIFANAPWAQLIGGNLEVIAPAEYATAKAIVPMPTWSEKSRHRT